jgi:hypothetical protein
MKTSSVSLLLCAVISITGCASRPKANQNFDGAYIEYSLPFTSVQVTARMVITACGNNPQAKTELTLLPVAGASPYTAHTLRVRGEHLTSFNKKRDLKIELYPHRAIKSINSTVADRTGAILVNVLKIMATAAASSGGGGVRGQTCNEATRAALARTTTLKGQIEKLRNGLDQDPVESMKQIDVLAAELGRIESTQLTLNLTKIIPLDVAQNGGIVNWSWEELGKWLVIAQGSKPSNFGLAWCVEDWAPDAVANCLASTATTRQSTYNNGKASAKIPTPACPDDANCAVTIVFLDPKPVEIVVASAQGDLTGGSNNALGRMKFPLPQAGSFSYFPLKVGFGGSKSLSLALDEFGQRTSFGWSSGARGEEITGAAQSTIDAAAAWQTARDTHDVKQDKAAIDALETQQKRNKLEACRAIIEAGGYTCPSP